MAKIDGRGAAVGPGSNHSQKLDMLARVIEQSDQKQGLDQV